ncbi:aspartyl/glutamyl-tRNA(Asn/Gln) amidotransferase, C subunit [Ehrlichia chaffeensis str. Heartland]|uniref:Aspartyl/glutamyl-tRNA(Asn/Gln) amidotransferase subunit C n=1 Tax=Ehrlichia chaffeensis (strain ATCC CRL-10679 / Arkansas) TaxID=205920 RepID=Q2GFH2_EHRCR|nr:Asp-tRNA(Asn)/Glu-tRNA(Gln) amidotransferase subunit GatC [Ehrlichia chaffeensis]ABD45379.1 glutamyl-tRNA(Gln) amidotransferase subunit C [Ehrlichia chaffeensis str. Arkansas]AHX03313.1 aspartyl/glutamyl-tRNA(Asn/Gln) amidotransferase, C subunit [Ehrlichia chaffeensis str. Heartland]AHX05232.1 aspartyl/glutamyl-tRNA(Asn/Gln) amidotransferase, C subunit [Ehrlichia chaffeensis str. Jax]AHX06218.1 aspartyl/glutamyl-tRNA(Asn/Gln) amidotransferase, C subunit [Ehrlichia chaffeensis str. Liberty]A
MIEDKFENSTHSKTSKSLTKNDILQAAKLTRIKLNDEEIDYHLKELEQVLNWIQTISEVDTQDVTPMGHGGVNYALPLRKDIINDGNIKDTVLSQSPKQEHDFFVVPKVIE